MNKYYLKYDDDFVDDVKKIYDYINNNFCSRKAALNFINKMDECLLNIKTMPEAYKLYNKKYGGKTRWRYACFKKYTIFYSVNKNTIYIHRLIYSKRNINKILDRE